MQFRLIGFLLATLLLNSCISVKPLAVKSVTCCDVVKAVKSDAEIGFKVEIENPNDFPITVKKYDVAVRINGNTIGNVTTDEATVLEANSVLSKPLSITTSTKQLISGSLMMGLSALLSNDPTTLELEVFGSVTGKAKGISKRVKVREKFPLQLHP